MALACVWFVGPKTKVTAHALVAYVPLETFWKSGTVTDLVFAWPFGPMSALWNAAAFLRASFYSTEALKSWRSPLVRGAQHLDLRPPNDLDPLTVTEARNIEMAKI